MSALHTRPAPAPDALPQVALRSGVEVRRDVLGANKRRPAPGMQFTVRDAVDSTPAAAAAVLLHMGALHVLHVHAGPGARLGGCHRRWRWRWAWWVLPCCCRECQAHAAPASRCPSRAAASGPAAQWADSLLGYHNASAVRECVFELVKMAADCLSRQERRVSCGRADMRAGGRGAAAAQCAGCPSLRTPAAVPPAGALLSTFLPGRADGGGGARGAVVHRPPVRHGGTAVRAVPGALPL